MGTLENMPNKSDPNEDAFNSARFLIVMLVAVGLGGAAWLLFGAPPDHRPLPEPPAAQVTMTCTCRPAQ